MGRHSKTELLRALAMLALGGATVSQLVGIQTRLMDSDEAAPAQPAVQDAADLVASELRRTESGGLLHAAADAIVLRVPAAAGVTCAHEGGETVIAVLPSHARTAPERAAAAIGWYDADGGFMVREERLAVRPVTGSACVAAGIAAPDGSTFLAVSPTASAARIGAPTVLFDHVEYTFGPSAREIGEQALWRRSRGVARELIAPVAADAGFRFYVDASAVPTAMVPEPLARVRGIEVRLPPTSVLATGSGRQTAVVFFRHAAT